jgi:hypothetical protein
MHQRACLELHATAASLYNSMALALLGTKGVIVNLVGRVRSHTLLLLIGARLTKIFSRHGDAFNSIGRASRATTFSYSDNDAARPPPTGPANSDLWLLHAESHNGNAS